VPVAENSYKKPFLMRKVQEKEAEEEIKDYDGKETNTVPESNPRHNGKTTYY